MDSLSLAGQQNTPTSDVSGSLRHDINNILSMLDSPVPEVTPTDSDSVPDTQQLDQHILKDVVAFVEVRSQNENRSRCIIKELTQLGAQVVPKFTNDVTHVIFKDGKKATREKADKKGIHLVSVLWIDSCKRSQNHVAESLFRPVFMNNDTTPVVGRLKKMKSMQPKDFDEEVALSTERAKNKRQRKVFSPKWKVMETPFSPHLPRIVYAGDTQPMSPFSMDMMSPSITVPDTPPSMRRKLLELQRKRANAGDSDVEDVTTPRALEIEKSCALQRRLFDGNLSLMSSPACPQTPNSPVAGPSELTFPAEHHVESSTQNDNTTSECDATVHTAADKPRKRKRKLFIAIPDIQPPPELLEPTKMTKAMQTKPKIFTLSKGSGSGKRDRKKNDFWSDDSDEKLNRKAIIPVKRVRVNDAELVSLRNIDVGSVVIPPSILKSQCVTRRQSIAVSTPTQSSVNNSAKTTTRRGRKSMAVMSTDSAVSASPQSPDTTAEVNITVKQVDTAVSKNKISEIKVNRRRSMRINPNRTIMEANEEEQILSERLLSQGLNDTGANVKEPLLTSRRASRRLSCIGTKEVCPADFDSTADDSVILKPLKRRYLKIISSARKKKVATSESESDETSFGDKPLQTRGKLKGTQASQIPCLSHSRKSLEDFHPSQFDPISRHKKMGALHTQAIDTSEDRLSKAALTASLQRLVRKTSITKSARSTSSSDDSQTSSQRSQRSCRSKKHNKQPKITIVTTSMHRDDKDLVQSIIKQLGGFHVVSDVTDSTTHVVCGGARRTLNVLYAIVRGAWLMSKEWVMKSLEAGEWIDEEPFELHDYFPAAQKSRLQRVMSGENYMAGLLSEVGHIYVADQTTPPHHHLIALIKLMGGQCTQCARKADLCVGTVERTERDCVTEQWLLDSITSFRCLQYSKYPIQTDREKRESSPEF